LSSDALITRPSLRRAAGSYSLATLIWLIPFAIALIYIVVFAVQLPHNLRALWWDSDYASGFTVTQGLAEAGTGGHTLLGSTGAYVPLWFGLLTASLPLHRELWEIGPTALFILTALTVGWSVRQVASTRAAALSALLIFVASPWALDIFMAAVSHNIVYPTTALVGAYLVWLARGGRRRRLSAFAVPVLAGIALGTCLASDLLLALTAVIPLAVVGLLAAVRRDRRSRIVGVSALTTAVLAAPIARLTSVIMGSLGYVTLPPSSELASFSMLPLHGELLLAGLKRLFNGYLGPEEPGPLHAQLGVACDVVMAAALLTLLVVGARTVVSFIWTGLRRARAESEPIQLATSLHVIFWVGSALVTCVGFAFNTRVENTHAAYYATVIFSVAAVVPLLMRLGSPVRFLLAVGASIFFAASLLGLTSHYMDNNPAPIAPDEAIVVKLAKANHVKVGYAGYWDAASLTWNSDERVLVRPAGNSNGRLVPFSLERVPAWYVPQQRHTFLLVDANEPYINYLSEGLGRPLATYSFGAVHMYIYPYDIAAQMGPPPD
jgi:hypothetical protein